MEKRTYKAQKRSDYKEPLFTATHVELVFDLDDEATVVKSIVQYKRLTSDLKAPLVLDGEDLVLRSVKVDGLACKYKVNKDKLEIASVPNEFELEIVNVINPTANTSLMGLYRSNGAFCTQCEPQGFRRITYFLDRSDVLATYKVTILGPVYGCGVLLSNGNLIEQGTQKGREYAIWEDPFPKPSYLFALVAGTFDIIEDKFITKSGRKVDLALYVDRGAHDKGLFAMQSIKDSMKWDEDRFDLEYDLDNFKVVAVDFFNFGAMENKSLNIFNSIYVMVDPQTATDTAFYNVQSVIGHEYFHNYTGDRVTLRDWFQLSLKESLTVFRDQEFSSDVASRALTRLHAINVIRGPQFAEDASPMAHPVRPEEVMEMNNFYTVTIYDKGAEIIRMIHTLIGEQKFKLSLKYYLETYDGKAVTIEDFLVCMEKIGQVDLTQFRRWYTQAGTPLVKASWEYDKEQKQLVLTLEQATKPTKDQAVKEPFYMPIRISFIDEKGHDVKPAQYPANGVLIFDKEKAEYRFNLDEHTLPVLLRDFSAPVKLKAPYTLSDYQRMISFVDDAFIKVDSAICIQNRYLHDNLKNASCDSVLPEPKELIDSYRSLLNNLNDNSDLILLNETLKIQSIENVMETFESIDIDAIYKARSTLEKKVSIALLEEFTSAYNKVKASSNNYSVANMAKRAFANTCLAMMALALKTKGQVEKASALVLNHYNKNKNMTDRLAAMTQAVHLDLPCQDKILESFEKEFSHDTLAFDHFFKVQATIPSDRAIDKVKSLLNHPCYDGTNPNRVRALVGAMALSNPVALHDISGRAYTLLCDEIKKLNSVNPSVAARILTPLLSYKRFDKKRQELIEKELKGLMQLDSLSRSLYEKVNAALKD